MNAERRNQIIRLLEAMDDGLPMPVRREHSTSGFVNEPRSRSCPDCLANGKVMFGCETCGGSGTVLPAKLDVIAAPDVLPDDGQQHDPYQENKPTPYGLTGQHHDRRVAIDAAISRAGNELRRFPGFRPQSTRDEIEEANKNPEPWERERAVLRARYDLDALAAALEQLRDRDAGLAALVVAVYAHGFVEPSTTVEAGCDIALRFISDRMPAVIRAPGDVAHPAVARQQRRSAA